MVDKINIMLLGDAQSQHKINNTDCDECWRGYPKKCECSGLIHASFGDENYDGDYYLFIECDKCGESEQ